MSGGRSCAASWPHGYVALACVLVVAGCARGQYDLTVYFGADIDPESVRFIEVWITPGCPPEAEVMRGVPPTDTVARVGFGPDESRSLADLGRVPAGTYGLYARGLDATCQVVAAACIPVTLSDGGTGVLTIQLHATGPAPACDASLCTDGRCQAPDGGLDGDACAPFPCAPGDYCVDIADPAPVDPAGRTCRRWTECGIGELEAEAPTTTSDRLCQACDGPCGAGLYESGACADGNAPRNRTCTVLTNCAIGQREVDAPTPTRDRACAACASPCAPNEYESSPCANGNGASDRACAPCDPSCAYCDGPLASDCVACAPGQFMTPSGCEPLSDCGFGQYQSAAPTATSDRGCSPCTVCTASEYASTDCANGSAPQNRVCATLTSCSVGEYQSVAPSLTSDRTCSTCTTCSAGQYEVVPCADGNAPQNRVCANVTYQRCPSGTVMTGRTASGVPSCQSIAVALRDYMNQSCFLYFGWREGCTGCTDPPTKWGRVSGASCEHNGGVDDTCATNTLSGANVRLLGINTDTTFDGDVGEDDAFYVGFQCEPSGATSTTLDGCPPGHFVYGIDGAGTLHCTSVGRLAEPLLDDSCAVHLAWIDFCGGSSCLSAPWRWANVGSGSCDAGLDSYATCTNASLGSTTLPLGSVGLYGLRYDQAGAPYYDSVLDGLDKLYLGWSCASPPFSAESTLVGDCPPDSLTSGLGDDGSVVCTSQAAGMVSQAGSSCYVYLGWRDGCDGCTTDPSRWGRSNALPDGCQNGSGSSNVCIQPSLGGESPVLFGLNTGGIGNDDDKFYVGFACY